MKKIYKYATGQQIPKGAVYLCTKVQTRAGIPTGSGDCRWDESWLVWHYFLVEVDELPPTEGKE